jgi:hypothetical protein
MNLLFVRVSRPRKTGTLWLCGGLLPFAVFMVLSFLIQSAEPPGFLLSNLT